ncbi:TPA: IS21 family transposase, partial [Escherichia coli]|nr:IS21 family transposase [Escherichia coli]HAL6354846.1 IS21 family transposase [Escherichia coli]HAZ3508306.1 IS21 family transposase [Escherichia coli]
MVHDNQKTSPEPPARKTGHKRVKLKSFMDYIDICLAENVRNDEVIFAEIKAMCQ